MAATHKTKRITALRAPFSADVSAGDRNCGKSIRPRRGLRSVLFVHDKASLAAVLTNERGGQAPCAAPSITVIIVAKKETWLHRHLLKVLEPRYKLRTISSSWSRA